MEKPLQIAFKDLDSSPYLEGLIRERVSRLERFHNRIIGCRVVVDIPHRSPRSAKQPIGISVEVEVPGRNTIVAKDEENRHDTKNDQTVVINRVFDAVQRQLEDAVEIQRGDVKLHDGEMETGLVVRLFPEQNYGFIEVKGAPDLYFTRNAVTGGDFDDLSIGTIVQVTRATAEGPMGPQASSVRLLNARRSPS
ncbi:MAG TPA: HPF/RaiA family ribosome-associated protein [Ferrovibrio sp.]|jgi:cold shock CspA family protein/ribosome-associated translation inhibitor RaiA|uniref:HPF/RaiA family ribosome-associated protein n=1 Tax=Ferrovibrio sp. TaxID=1917215 RepID=UPI002B4ACA2B|nr:HPF/RaiA family ribosome-associated protein [Ferrovibrio sp.]HLT76185.1 HPF/RaiA family ribosome-associated protein [Ferrovibrio sp.]